MRATSLPRAACVETIWPPRTARFQTIGLISFFEFPRSMTHNKAFEATSRKMFHDRSTFAPSLRHNLEHHHEPRVIQPDVHAPRKHVLHHDFYHATIQVRGEVVYNRFATAAAHLRRAATRPRTKPATSYTRPQSSILPKINLPSLNIFLSFARVSEIT